MKVPITDWYWQWPGGSWTECGPRASHEGSGPLWPHALSPIAQPAMLHCCEGDSSQAIVGQRSCQDKATCITLKFLKESPLLLMDNLVCCSYFSLSGAALVTGKNWVELINILSSFHEAKDWKMGLAELPFVSSVEMRAKLAVWLVFSSPPRSPGLLPFPATHSPDGPALMGHADRPFQSCS